MAATTLEMKRDAIIAGLRAIQGAPYSTAELKSIRTNGGSHAGLTDQQIDELCDLLNGEGCYIVMQEGGSSGEGPYLSSWDSEDEAEEHRADCAGGSYRTSAPIEVPSLLAAFGEDLYTVIEAVAQAEFEMADCPDTGD